MPDAIPGKLVAPEPVPPVRQYSFTDWQVNNPSAPPPGDRLDAEFDRGNGTQSQTLDWVGTSLNTDGTLRTGIVGEPQLVPGLFDHIADDAVAQVQPLVVEAENAAGQALNSASAALSYSTLAGGSATQAGQSATTARGAATGAQTSASAALDSANAASASAADAANSANHADGDAALCADYGLVTQAWAEHMPDTIPPNILAVMGVTGDHWSSRWWANRAAETLGEMEDLLGTIPPLAVVFYYTFIARAGQTVFTGADRDGKVLTYTPGPQQTMLAYVNGLLRTPVDDYTTSLNTLTFNIPRVAGDIVQIQVEGVATGESVYLPLAGGTMTGAITLAADPAGPLQPVTRQYADAHYLPFTGGTLTGPLILAADPTAARGAATKQYVDAKAGSGLLEAPNNTYAYGRKALNWSLVPSLVQVTNTGFDLNTITGTGAGPFTGYVGFHQVANQTVGIGAANFPGAENTGFVLTGFNSNAGWDSQLFMGAVHGTSPALYYRASTGQGVFSPWYQLITSAGGTLTGPLIMAADPVAALGTATKQYVDNHAPLGGPYLPLAGGTVTGNLGVNGAAAVAGDFSCGGAVRLSASGAYFSSDASYTRLVQDSGGWQWRYNRSSGVMQYVRGSDGAALFTLDSGGNATVPGVSIASAQWVNSGSFGVTPDGNYNSLWFGSGAWCWRWTRSTGFLEWVAGGTSCFAIYPAGNTAFTQNMSVNGSVTAAGFVNASDERLKIDIVPATHGLDAILAIEPITFRRWDSNTKSHRERVELGFGAGQLQAVLPEAVVPMDVPPAWTALAGGDEPVLGVQLDPIVAALVNAVRALHARLDALETRH